jgi:putative flippase GtrA
MWILTAGNTKASLSILLATVFGRAISSLINFIFNKWTVFKSDMPVGKTITRYYILVVVQMSVSYLLVCVLSHFFGVAGPLTVTIKIMVDVALFFVSFQFQRQWVFNNDPKEIKAKM